MRLNHLNLTVPNVSASRAFFEKYFGIRCIAERGRDTIAIMLDESGFVFSLSNFEKATEVAYPGAFHIGFMQDSAQRVDEIYAQMKADGIVAEPPREFHGAWTFYVRDPGGIVVEVGHQHRRESA